MSSCRTLALVVILSSLAGCSRSSSPATATERSTPPSPPSAGGANRTYLLETVDDVAVVQLYADGFSSLPVREKTLIWHLYQAAVAGRDIYYDQKHRSAVEMRKTLEAIIRHPAGIDATTLAEIQRYTKLFWINNGPYNNLTARKFVLRVSSGALVSAAQRAAANGGTFPTRANESLDALLARLQPMFLDPSVDPSVTTKTPGAGTDMLAASANNLYAGGVTMADLTSYRERHGLNSRLVKRNGRLQEEVYKIDGRYAKEIAGIVGHLEAAIPYATESMATALRALIQWYRTGEDADRVTYDIAWVKDTASPVDTINGFIEVYLDPRGIKAGWEAVVFYVNPQKTGRIKTFATHAQWFENRMPYDATYRKPRVTGIVANAIDVVMEAGDAGPVTPIGINLPNDQTIREQYGSKSVSLANVRDASDNSTPGSMRGEFSWTPEEVARAVRFGSIAAELLTDMHEVIGHASGQQAAGFTGTPQAAIKEFFSALEEGRADLVGLYFIADPKLAELGIVPAADQQAIARTMYESYTRNALVQLRRVAEGTQIEEDHMRNRQMVIRWLMANTTAIEMRQRDGKTYLVMVDAAAFRDGVGRLLAEIQRIKSEGDFAAAKALFETHGIHFDPALRDQVVRRVAALKLPSYTGFVMPTLTPRRAANGAIADVTISYPMDLTTQMLEFAAMTK